MLDLTPDLIQEKCMTYVPQCRIDGKPVTLTGLALHIGADSIDHVYELMTIDEKTAKHLKRALLEVEHFYERCLLSKDTTGGSQFVLSKMGWSKNQAQINIINKLDAGVNYAELPDTEVIALLNVIQKKEQVALPKKEEPFIYEQRN